MRLVALQHVQQPPWQFRIDVGNGYIRRVHDNFGWWFHWVHVFNTNPSSYRYAVLDYRSGVIHCVRRLHYPSIRTVRPRRDPEFGSHESRPLDCWWRRLPDRCSSYVAWRILICSYVFFKMADPLSYTKFQYFLKMFSYTHTWHCKAFKLYIRVKSCVTCNNHQNFKSINFM